ncbi:hypothetical protein L2D04_22700 (plasmid) [Pantoea agglomerans]|uniref:hypothetical protein n=1 Tax=Enterobacter agglomerans TaxID=549 RepID=UPI001F2DBE51|nr:hypothetical protein [Pantoea agglomerans]UJQ26194.1 hypothetical protein L2D04_22700 [Pantoea agglomerans]
MKIKSNGLVKVLVPAVLVAGGFIAVKSHNSKTPEPAAQTTAQADPALANLSRRSLRRSASKVTRAGHAENHRGLAKRRAATAGHAKQAER